VTVDAKRFLGWQTYVTYYSSFIEIAIEVEGDLMSWPALDSSQILGGFPSIAGSFLNDSAVCFFFFPTEYQF